MKDFIHTGFYFPTMTTVDDPELRVIESDNGINWLIRFYVGEQLIDCINMEYPRGTEIHEDVKNLVVVDDENTIIGTVEERLRYAIDLDLM